MPGSTLASQGRRLQDGQARAALTFSWTSLDRVFRGTRETEDLLEREGSRALAVLEFNVQVSAAVRLDFGLPVQDGEYDTTVAGSPTTFRRRGIGDISGWAVWSPWGGEPDRESFLSTSNVSFALGLKLPTGRVSNDGTLDTPVKLGTGSVDFMLGAAWSGAAFERFEMFASLFVTINGPEGEPEAPGGAFLSAGDIWTAKLGAAWRATDWLRLSISLDVEKRGRSRLDGSTLDASGGTIIALSPGLSVRLSQEIWLMLGVSVPVHRDVNDEQLVAEETWSAGVSWWF